MVTLTFQCPLYSGNEKTYSEQWEGAVGWGRLTRNRTQAWWGGQDMGQVEKPGIQDQNQGR
jgi:hypothetical protein